MTRDQRTARDYDRIASSYAREVGGELAGKPLDRALLAYLVERSSSRGPVGDLGCGPGHVARHIADLGAEVIGIDLSPEMVRLASAMHLGPRFLVGDIRCLPLSDASLGGALAFYSLIHFDRDEDVRGACAEIKRVLTPGAEVVVAYHRGDQVVRPGEMWGTKVDLEFRFLPDALVASALADAGLDLRARIQREPYVGIEHPSQRSYLIAARPASSS
jgi:SAM-dependent methyltransferase